MLTGLQAKLIGAAVVVVILAGIALGIYNKGKAAGQIEGARAQLETDRQQFEQDRQVFLAQLKKYQEADDAAKAQVAAKDAEIAGLRRSRAAAAQSIRNLPDEKIVADILERLGEAPGATLSNPQLRRLDGILADSQNLEQQVAALEAKVAAQDQRIDAIEHQRDAAIASYNKLVPLYTKAYNAAQRKHSLFVKIITFGLVRDRKIDLPDPVTLEHP